MNSKPDEKPFQTLEDLQAYQLARDFRKKCIVSRAGCPTSKSSVSSVRFAELRSR